MKQVKRFAKGGTTPDELIEKMQRGLASRAYDEAMPEADTTFGKLPSTQKEMPSKYSSVRSNDFEKNVQQEKRDAVKQGLSGAGKMAKQAGKPSNAKGTSHQNVSASTRTALLIQ